MIPNARFDSAASLACLLATVGLYALARWLYRRHRRAWLQPLVTAPLVLLALLQFSGVGYGVYLRDTHWLMWMMGPATVAYAYPIYQRRALLRRYPLSLGAGVLSGLVLGVLGSWLLAHLFELPQPLARSMLTRSVSTPFAMAASGYFGASPDIAALCVLGTGVFGLLVGEAIQARIGLRSAMSRGASLGAAAHAAGTARAYELDPESGAVSSLTMVFAGIAMVLMAPWIGHWFA
ncbi:LrgB family protein [Thiomonas sp.]|jgi:putative effector of murein hydrolase|uniref:LrgB family protein n=1 Tax=Thiomonas sp. TaxID=2047785 RepID=UPI0026358100|nr:LrgB family protein [Thiomonas sp.]